MPARRVPRPRTHRLVTVLLTLLLAAVGGALQAGPASAASINPGSMLKNPSSGRCLDVPAGNTASGTGVTVYDCNGGANQRWTFATGRLTTVGGVCLDEQPATAAAPPKAVVAPCNGAASQQWTLNVDGSISNDASRRCLDVANGATANGSGVVTWPCNAAANQKWTTAPEAKNDIQDTLLVGLDSGRCLDLFGANTAPGSVLGLYDCTPGSPNQSWTHTPTRQLTVAGGVCLEDRSTGTAPGTRAVIAPCTGALGQRWALKPTGEIVSDLSGLCLDAASGSRNNGTAAILWTCNGAGNQRWTADSPVTGFVVPVSAATFETTGHLDDGAIGGPPGNRWNGGTGVYNPNRTYYTGLEGGTLSTGSMSGETVGYLYGSSPTPLEQTLTTNVTPDATYRLVLAVGGRSNGNPFAGAGIDLLVGGQTVATRLVQEPPVAGSFGDISLTWSAPAWASGALGIRVRALTPTASSYVDVDNVRLLKNPERAVDTPQPHQIVQREPNGRAGIVIAGRYAGADTVQARFGVRPGFQGVSTGWLSLPVAADGSFSGRVLDVRPGWYDAQVLVSSKGNLPRLLKVGEVGVGEIFIIAGQSNSANWGESPQTPGDPRVSATNAGSTRWQFAQDPQPNADGGPGGSAWPAFGTRYAQTTGIPIGVISVGVGGTSTAQWQPGGDLYQHLQSAIRALKPGGFRAVLWHQGETDASACTPTATYIQNMRNIIGATREEAGFQVPWGIARASYLSSNSPSCMNLVDAAQAQLPTAVPGVFAGPDTNDYNTQGPLLWDDIHFSNAGLSLHGNGWVDAVKTWGGVPAR